MNQTRSFLLIAWLVVATLLWIEWSKAPAPGAAATNATSPSNSTAGTLPGAAPAAPLAAAGETAPLPAAAGPRCPPSVPPPSTARHRPR